MTSSEEDVTVEKLDLKPEWLEGTRSEKRDVFGPYLVFLLVGAGLFIVLLFTAGNLTWFVGFVLLLWVGLSFIYAAGKDTKNISTWGRKSAYDKVENLPLERDSDTMERALKGLELSQTIVEKRLRKAFMEKLMDEKDLSMKEVKELLRRPSQLEKIVDDEELEDFLLNSKRITDVIGEKDDDNVLLEREKERDRSFEKKIRDVIKRISGWESR